MTTMREALTKAVEEFETHARDYRRASARWRANGYDMDAAEMNRRAEVDEAMAKMCRDALAENDGSEQYKLGFAYGINSAAAVADEEKAAMDQLYAKHTDEGSRDRVAARGRQSALIAANIRLLSSRVASADVPAFFRLCAECQWPNICGNANPCTLANLGVDPAQRSRFDMAADGTMRIGMLTADEWDGMVKPRQILPTHRHERSGYKLQPPIFITTEFETYIVQ